MADRFPLILNTSANQIQEIASGDTLDLTGSNIKGVGIITAGNLSGNIIAGAGSSNIVAGVITATQIDLNGDIDVDGHTNLDNVNVGGATTTTGVLNITANTASTNTTSGALRVAGGAGIQGSVNIGESVNIDADLDVDGHTNLDNVSVAGVSTFAGNINGKDITLTDVTPSITFYDSNANSDFRIIADNGVLSFADITNNANRINLQSNGNVNIQKDLDVDGHTNLDNVNIAGVVTATGSGNFGSNLNITGTSPFIDLVDSDHNSDYKIENDDGTFKIKDMSNANAVRYQLGADGKHYIYGDTAVMGSSNLTVGGNLSVGGVLTYEDVTNVDSVGIVTARQGVRLGVDGTSSANYISVGAGNDLKIWHQSSNNHSYISESGSGSLIVLADDFYVQDTSTNTMISAKEGAEVNLHFNGGTAKLSTTNTGVTISGTASATTFSGSGASLTNLPAANLTGTAAAINGSNITNVNAATVGGIAAGSFLRSDATDTASGAITFTSGAIQLSGHWYSGFHASTTNYIHLYPNGHSGSATQTNIRAWNGSGSDVFQINGGSSTGLKWRGNTIWTAENDGSGSTLDADTVDGIQGSNIVTLSGSQTIAGTKTFNCSGYDIQLDYDSTRTLVSILRSGTEKVRLHTSGDTILVETFNSGVIRWKSGLVPNADDTYDLGATGTRWRNLYVNDLQLSNESKKDKGGNDVDGTWGDWTLQEGDENIFMLNNRTGKKYKINLTEVE